MVPCIVFLSLGAGPGDSSGTDVTEEYTEGQKQLFAVISVIFAMSAPFFWTTKIFYMRLSEDHYKFNLFDNAIDSSIY